MQRASSIPASGRLLRWALLLAAVAGLALLLSGCGQGVKVIAFKGNQIDILGQTLTEIEQEVVTLRQQAASLNIPADIEEMPDLLGQARREELGFGKAQLRAKGEATRGRAYFLQGYYQEARGDYEAANNSYLAAQRTKDNPYVGQATYRIAVLARQDLIGAGHDEAHKIAKNNLRALAMANDASDSGNPFTSGGGQTFRLLVRQPAIALEGGVATLNAATAPALTVQPLAKTARAELDELYRTGGGLDAAYYKYVDAYVTFFKRFAPVYGPALALIVLALLVKLVTIPMTAASYRGIRDMQRIQPMLKELQEKYKDDRAKFAEEQMKLMKEHNVSPLGGCLPMLIQIPIFIVVYQAVAVYTNGFADAGFLWIGSLALPDLPLMLLYLVSMIATQKLTPTTSTDPQMQAQQRMMTYMMPIMLFIFLISLASAFVLYWFFLNIFSAAHQYYLLRKFKMEEEAAAPAAPAAKAVEQKNTGSARKKGKR